VQHVLERAGQPVELQDHDRVARAELIEHPVQLGPVPPAARRRLLEEALAAGGPERFCLQQVGLVIPLGNTGIAQEHAGGGRSFTNGRLGMVRGAATVPCDSAFSILFQKCLRKAIAL